MDSIENINPSTSERRRAIYERAAERHRARGTRIDGDPAFVALISEWIDGKIDMAEVAKRSSPRPRSAKTEPVRTMAIDETAVPMSSDQLLSELDRIIGMRDMK
jgi:hypothetical protein